MSKRFRGCGHPARVSRFRLALFNPLLTPSKMSAGPRTKEHSTERISFQWALDEVPDRCFFRSLCTKPGNILDGQLPIAHEEQTIRNAFNRHPILALTAEPAAGKSTQMPWFVYRALSRWNSGNLVQLTDRHLHICICIHMYRYTYV